MKFIVDAQLPKVLSELLVQFGFDSIHTIELPKRNATDDEEVSAISMREGRIVITKDKDFLESYILRNIPEKLLLVSTGNISNEELLQMFTRKIKLLQRLLENHNVIELNKNTVVVLF
ncbi:MAG: DUF5615 family PIN-like protein [Ignavibacteriales bacterium]|nr:DUF5615 family PIN-like protein [Ignavibacteriales bacterium]